MTSGSIPAPPSVSRQTRSGERGRPESSRLASGPPLSTRMLRDTARSGCLPKMGRKSTSRRARMLSTESLLPAPPCNSSIPLHHRGVALPWIHMRWLEERWSRRGTALPGRGKQHQVASCRSRDATRFSSWGIARCTSIVPSASRRQGVPHYGFGLSRSGRRRTSTHWAPTTHYMHAQASYIDTPTTSG